MKTAKRKRDKNLLEMSEEHKSSAHRIDKHQVNLKAAEASKDLSTGDLGGTFTPDADQLAQINQFTKKTVGADDVVAFNTMSCNDMYDRDDERFTPDTIQQFAALEPPFSFTGKSFMADHDYQMAKVRGRIFDTGTAEQDGVNFVTNQVYVPNTPQYANYIENLDFGLAWAVSVGVMIDKANCSMDGCGAQVFTSRFFGSWCAEGHEKGYFYVAGEEEDDGWGYFLPVDPDTPGATKAMVDLSDPIDAYELSQVFLGAQYMAELAKKPTFSGMLKAASARSIPIIGLSHKEAEEIPVPEEDQAVTEARANFTVTTNEDGEPTWTDDQGLVWIYTVNDDNTSEVMCLGRSAGDGEEQQQGEPPAGEELRSDGQGDPEGGNAADPDAGDLGGEVAGGTPGGSDADAGEREVDPEPTDPNDEKEKTVSKKSLLAGLRAAKVPTSLIDKVEGVDGDDLPTLLTVVADHMLEQDATITDLTPRAALGDTYLKQLRADAIHWYTMAHSTEPNKPVSTTSFQKILDAVGHDPDVLLQLIEDNKVQAQGKFPEPTRRTAHDKAPEDVEPGDENNTSSHVDNAAFAQRIHR